MSRYNFKDVEAKWQAVWDKNQTFKAEKNSKKPKYYVLDMFPYPSGAGLHVGHAEGYTATDIVARAKRMQGYHVLHPMGWDAFGLPAEQYAVKTGTHPAITTAKNIDNFRQQCKALGFSYDWSREVNTTDPKYYKWTQWIFLKLHERGLAYVDEVPVNWCEEMGAILANEEVPEYIEKGYKVVRRPMRQWMLKITAYAEKLLQGLDDLDWPDATKDMQRNWIGKTEGAEIDFKIDGHDETITVYTTRPDTLYGVTYVVLAPEHPLVAKLVTSAQSNAVKAYQDEVALKSDLDRTDKALEKTGVTTGAEAIHPLTGEKIPIWIGDYVLVSYGTGAVMGVPGHDQRDWEFARQFGLPMREVVQGGDLSQAAFTEPGVAVNSPEIDGLETAAAKTQIIQVLEKAKHGRAKVNYRLRDWLFSRQRYWGEPVPMVIRDGSMEPVPVSDLPLELPETEDFKPSKTGESPLAKLDDWVNLAEGGRRETNTMPQWAGSCWYFLRYADPHNENELVSKEDEAYWLPVDLYIGGAEHAVLHLLYARFWAHVLHDAGVIAHPEPFQRLVHQGLILGEMEYTLFETVDGKPVPASEVASDERGHHQHTPTKAAVQPRKIDESDVEKRGEGFVAKDSGVAVMARAHKMSKSRGNVVSNESILESYPADALRMYLMFMGPLEQSKPWSTGGLEGIHRFIQRVWRLIVDDDGTLKSEITAAEESDKDIQRLLHQTIQKVTEDIDALRFNTAISQFMIALNGFAKAAALSRDTLETFVKLLSPFAPHLAEELWQILGHTETLAYEPWPEADPAKLTEDTCLVVVQVNGKVRAKLEVAKGISQDEALALAKQDEAVQRAIEDKEMKRVIFVPDKLLNLVVPK